MINVQWSMFRIFIFLTWSSVRRIVNRCISLLKCWHFKNTYVWMRPPQFFCLLHFHSLCDIVPALNSMEGGASSSSRDTVSLKESDFFKVCGNWCFLCNCKVESNAVTTHCSSPSHGWYVKWYNKFWKGESLEFIIRLCKRDNNFVPLFLKCL